MENPFVHSLNKLSGLDYDFTAVSKILLEKSKAYSFKNYAPLVESFFKLPCIKTRHHHFHTDIVEIGLASELNDKDEIILKEHLKRLIPWRKGPFKLFGHTIDAEWQSQIKWNLLKPFLTHLKNQRVLDIGANSGYYLFKILEYEPRWVLGIDPTIPFKIQFETLKKFSVNLPCFYEPLGIENLVHFPKSFDTIFCLGILYHQKSPIESIKLLKKSLAKNGILYLETLVIEGEKDWILAPQKSYGKMTNCYFIPTVSALKGWCYRAGFETVKVLSENFTSLKEQRNTEYCPRPMQSLIDFLDPCDLTKTIEGYPAHKRAIVRLE